MTKISEKLLVKTPVFNVVEKRFKETDFKPVGINAKDWVLVLVKDGTMESVTNKVLPHILVKQTRWGIERKTIEFPCGTVEEGDYENEYVKSNFCNEEAAKNKRIVGAFSAAIREVIEETGIDISKEEDFNPLVKVKSFNPNPAYFNNTMTIVSVSSKKPLKEIFDRRKEQHLDKNEDCRVFIGAPIDYQREIEKHAMGLIAINIEDK